MVIQVSNHGNVSGNPLLDGEEERYIDKKVVMEHGEWNGLSELLRAYAEEEPEKAVAGTDFEPEELARNYADWIDENREYDR